MRSLRPRTGTLPSASNAKRSPQAIARALRGQNARAVLLVQLLEPRGEVHRVAQQSVAHALARADRASDHRAGADADAGRERHALVAEGAAATARWMSIAARTAAQA